MSSCTSAIIYVRMGSRVLGHPRRRTRTRTPDGHSPPTPLRERKTTPPGGMRKSSRIQSPTIHPKGGGPGSSMSKGVGGEAAGN